MEHFFVSDHQPSIKVFKPLTEEELYAFLGIFLLFSMHRSKKRSYFRNVEAGLFIYYSNNYTSKSIQNVAKVYSF